MPLTPDSVAAITRYREQALSAAALISALATTHVDPNSRLRDLIPRQDDQLRDLLHEFAYKARKTIELSEGGNLPLRTEVDRKSIVGIPPNTQDTDSALESYSLRFVLGRIIHSEDLRVERGEVPHEIDGALVHHEAPWGFTVRSDYDPPGANHFVFVEFLIQRFLEIDDHIQRNLPRP